MAILVTGGAGYIGSHTVVELLQAGEDVVVADNFVNSKPEVLRRIERITGKKPRLYEVDLRDLAKTKSIFRSEQIDSIIHFAGLKAVGESCAMPLEYYNNNLLSALNILECMRQFKVKNLVFSSSATVYGAPQYVPIREDAPLSTTNPYGTTKLFIERILQDFYAAYYKQGYNIALLRYFNPIGAHESGLIGEDPQGIPNNLLPYVARVAAGQLPEVHVFGNDYNTYDGTGVRDYIHVIDLARGHILAIDKLKSGAGLVVYNLGTGRGYSVFDIISAYGKAAGRDIPYVIDGRRPGDIAVCYADTQKAYEELGFQARLDLDKMCEDSFRWQSSNPRGYSEY